MGQISTTIALFVPGFNLSPEASHFTEDGVGILFALDIKRDFLVGLLDWLAVFRKPSLACQHRHPNIIHDWLGLLESLCDADKKLRVTIQHSAAHLATCCPLC